MNTLNDIRSMQRTLDKLVVWKNSWETDFNEKCVTMHIGKTNSEFHYQMNDGWVKSVNEERDLEQGIEGRRIQVMHLAFPLKIKKKGRR